MMRRQSGEVAAFVSIHAYSQFWMSPYGYTYNYPQDYTDHMRVMKKSQTFGVIFTFHLVKVH